MESLVNNVWLGRTLVTVFVLIEHLQVMSYGNRMIDTNSHKDWTTDGKNLFDGLGKMALRFTGDGFMAVYVLSVAFSLGSLLLYIVLLPFVHQWNKKAEWPGLCILFFDYVIFGIGFVPMVAALSEIQYCDDSGNIRDYSSMACWTTKQLAMTVFGFLGASAALIMSAVVFPMLKSERKGVECRYVDEVYFPAVFKLLEVGIINVFAAVHHAYLGLVACGVLAIYLGLFQCYRDPFIAAVKMSVLWGQFWVFCCAQEVTENHEIGTKMLAGWIPFMLVGYLVMVGTWFLWRRKSTKLALER